MTASRYLGLFALVYVPFLILHLPAYDQHMGLLPAVLAYMSSHALMTYGDDLLGSPGAVLISGRTATYIGGVSGEAKTTLGVLAGFAMRWTGIAFLLFTLLYLAAVAARWARGEEGFDVLGLTYFPRIGGDLLAALAS